MPTSAYSIAEFCRAHGVSRAFVYALLKRGEGPAVMKVGRRTLVSVEAAAEWRRRMEALAGTKPAQGGRRS
jgi:excisionase family DNA binding protein